MSEHLQDLLVKSQQGDQVAYQQFLSEMSKVLRPFVKKRLFNANEIEDVLQDILIALHQARHSYIPGKPLFSWVFAIARYKLIDHIRKTSRNKNDIHDEDLLGTIWAEDIDATIEADLGDHLKDALSTLSDTPRRIVTMLKIEGYKVREIAEKLNISESAVKTAAHRGYKQMRAYLEKTYGY